MVFFFSSRRRHTRLQGDWSSTFFFLKEEDGIRDYRVTGVQTCALPIATDGGVEIKRIAGGLFVFDEIARRPLSRHWAGRTHDEQTEFIGLFTDLLERSYMNRIEAYAGERILYTAEAVDGTYATVRSKVLTQRRSEIPLDYRMHLRDSRWQAYEVLIDGVSFVSTYRSQFDRVIQAESYGALVERLRKRNLDTAVVDRKKL